ncbi:unnamed protein product [Heligmosomoides polygyrus]|uniref:Uncharacterized protein n=1 Tax=Heligmosomoides polygyrus TaxID=6339 RepID=A0A3P8E799_HELPZ|nr:unnamed protein product [Heligmosomoides polygyrus]
MFGPDARCVVDEASFAVTSTHLQNATYECRCPHPVNGEYVDCLALHLSTSVSESITDVSTPMSVNIGFGQTTFVPSEAAATTATMEETEGNLCVDNEIIRPFDDDDDVSSANCSVVPESVHICPHYSVFYLSIVVRFHEYLQPSTMQSVPHTNAVPYSAIPSWMTATQPSWTSSSSISSTPELVTTSTPTTTTTTTIQATSSTTQNVTQNKDAGKMTKPVLAGDYMLGFLLLATTLFVLRYVRQSRKLHGKYNPAREEHALSAAFSMPMSHISKEERLI